MQIRYMLLYSDTRRIDVTARLTCEQSTVSVCIRVTEVPGAADLELLQRRGLGGVDEVWLTLRACGPRAEQQHTLPHATILNAMTTHNSVWCMAGGRRADIVPHLEGIKTHRLDQVR